MSSLSPLSREIFIQTFILWGTAWKFGDLWRWFTTNNFEILDCDNIVKYANLIFHESCNWPCQLLDRYYLVRHYLYDIRASYGHFHAVVCVTLHDDAFNEALQRLWDKFIFLTSSSLVTTMVQLTSSSLITTMFQRFGDHHLYDRGYLFLHLIEKRIKCLLIHPLHVSWTLWVVFFSLQRICSFGGRLGRFQDFNGVFERRVQVLLFFARSILHLKRLISVCRQSVLWRATLFLVCLACPSRSEWAVRWIFLSPILLNIFLFDLLALSRRGRQLYNLSYRLAAKVHLGRLFLVTIYLSTSMKARNQGVLVGRWRRICFTLLTPP